MGFRSAANSWPGTSESPKLYFYSDKLKTARRNCAFLLLTPLAWKLVLIFSDSRPPDFLYYILIPSLMISGLVMFFWGRGPAAELWHDHIRLPSRWPPYRLAPIRFSEVMLIQKVPNMMLSIVYESQARKRTAFLSIQFVADAEGLESALEQKTGLKVQVRDPWWNQAIRFMGADEDIGDRKFLWNHYVVRPLQWLAIVLANALVCVAIILTLHYFRKELPAWFFFWVPILTMLGSLYFWFRWRRRRRKHAEDSKAAPAL